MDRKDALALLQKYNHEPFHILHALTVEGVMKWYANELGYGDEADYWGLVGLLHDVDFEPEFIRAVCSHGFGICVDIKPEAQMEKILFAADELTGLIGAAAIMRPSKSTKDMEVKSLKKKFKDKRFAAGCSRDIITQGAELLGWELTDLMEKTILAMRSCEDDIHKEYTELTGQEA